MKPRIRRLATSGIVLYLAISAPFLSIPLVLYAAGVDLDTGLAIALLATISAGILATIWVARRYRATPEPRSIFFGMLVSALEVKVAFGAWVGYLIAATILRSDPFFIDLPVPVQPVRSLVTGIAAVGLLVSAVYYAATIAIQTAAQLRQRRSESGR